MSSVPRPTSPHLGVYRWQITMITSILHRATGIALYAGAVLLMGWLWSAAYAPEFYAKVHECLTSMFGKLVLVGFTLAFYYHLANGIRHLFWDMGKGFALPCAGRSGVAALLFALFMTLFTWGFALNSVVGG